MVTTKKFSRVAAMLLALVMILTLVPFQSFAASVPAEDLVLKDGVTVALSKDMTEDQINKALFDALVENPEGANYQDYSWEYECEGTWNLNKNTAWGSIFGFTSEAKVMWVTQTFTHPALTAQNDEDWQIRLAGTEKQVTVNKVSSCTVNYNYDLTQGTVLVNDAQVNGAVTGVSPKNEIQFTVVPKDGYKVASVTVNGTEVEAADGVYTVLPVATTDINVTFAEDGTFYNVAVNAGDGVTVKMNGLEVSGDVKVAEGVEYTFEYIPDENTSVKAVKLGDADVTSDVSFANYVGTQKLTFTGDTTLAVESIAKSAQLVLTDTREVGIAINADGSWNYDGIRANVIDALIDKAKSVGVEFTQDNVAVTYWNSGRTNGQFVDLEWYESWGITWDGQLTFQDSVKAGAVKMHLEFKGNDQFRPSDAVEVLVTFNDVQNSVIALKESPVVTISETSNGVFDYTDLEQKVFDAAIDAENSLPSGITLEDIELTVPEVTTTGDYDVTAKYPGSTSYYASEVTFKVHFDVVKLPTANIVLKNDTVDAVLKETSVGVYDNAALKDAVYAAAVDLAACESAGLDTSKLVFELQDVTTDGQYTATVSYPETDAMHGNSVTVTVNVTVEKLPTVAITAAEDATVTLYKNYDRTYDYEGLKDEIFENVLTVSNVEGLTRDAFTFKYKIVDAMGSGVGIGAGSFYNFEQGKLGSDAAGTYKYLNKGGNFEIKVSIPNGTNYYGSEITFNLNVEIGDAFVSEIVVNEGPFNFTLNMTRDRGYDYTSLKQAIFEAAVKEVKNVAGDVNWDDLTYSYEVGLGSNFHEFEVDKVDGDPGSIYNYLREGGDFKVRLSIADGNGYYGSFADIDVHVTVVDPYATEIKVNSEIAPVTLKETTVGNFDYASLKEQIFAAAIDAANSTPSNLTVDSFDFVIPEIKESGTYNVTANFKETYDNVAASVSFDVQVNVEVLPTATIVLKSNAVSVVLKETEVGVFDLETIKKAIFDGTVDATASNPALSYADVAITFDREVNADGKYTATITFAGTSTIHGTSAKVTVDVDVVSLPTVKIETQARALTLNKAVDGSYDYDGLKKAIFDECLRVTGVEGLTWDNFTYQYKILDAMGSSVGIGAGEFYNFDQGKLSSDAAGTYKYLYKGGSFEFKVSIADSSTYYGTSVNLTLPITVDDPYYTEIALKENYQKDYTLYFNDNGEYDYDRLEKEIFDAVIDLENSPANVNFDTATITYQILDAMGTSTGIGAGEYYDFAQGTLGSDAAGTYRYLYKGGTFNIKVAAPATENNREVEVVFSVNVQPFTRVASSVVLNSGSMNYTSDLNAIKAYVYSLINMNTSKLPADVSIDDFTFEYYARNYTAGDLPGVEHAWVPFEGMAHPSLAGSYYKQIGNGTNKIRVTFKGTDDYLASTSNEVEFTMSKASFSISLKQNYKYLDEKLPLDFVQPSVNDNFQHFYFILDASSDQATIYLDSLSGIAQTDISVLPSILFQSVLGRSAIEVYVEGLSRDELIKLINSDELVAYAQDNYNIDAAAINAMKDIVNNIPTSVTNIKLKEGQPTKPGTYTVFAMATNENYNTAFTSSVFYVKYHSNGTKLVFVQDTDGLNSLNVGKFDYSAVVTKDGVPVQSNNVRYIYTGFRSNALFYASTKEGPRQAGIYTQTAWTLGGTYAFPKTRTFVVSIL